MDELLLELALLEQADTAEAPKETKEEGARVSPYQSAAQEGMGLLSNLFQEIDEALAAVFDEIDAGADDESGAVQSEEGMNDA